MGLFVDRCQALIDPSAGRALTGDALAEARNNPEVPRCGHQVKKAARFCNKCGSPAPGGWWKCPSCSKWVGNESNFCWNCNTPLQPDQRPGMAGGTWQNRAGTFAERFDVPDIKKLLKEGLKVREGTVALVLDGGAYKDCLEPGQHNPDSLARRINHWGDPPPREIVLVEAGETVLPLRVDDLRSSEELPLRFYGEVVVRFRSEQAQAFLANFLKDRREASLAELGEALQNEIKHAVQTFCNTSTVEDIVKDPQNRLHLEDQLRETLQRTAESWGIAVVRVSAAEFGGRAYEELREKAGEVEAKRRESEFNQRMRELVNSERMGELQSEHELEEYVNQLAQERGVSDAQRDHELNRLKQVQRHEIEASEAAHEMEREAERLRHDVQLQQERDDYEREKERKDVARKMEDTEKAIELDRKVSAAEREDLEERARILQGLDVTTMIGVIDDAGKRSQLLEMHKLAQMKGESVEKMLAAQAADSPDAARALEAMAQQQASETDKREGLSREHSEQLERILTKTLESVGSASQKSGDTNIYK